MIRLAPTGLSSEVELFSVAETPRFQRKQIIVGKKKQQRLEASLLRSCSFLCRPLNKSYQEVLRSVFMSSSSSPSGANKKKSMKELQEEVANLYNNIRLFEKGIKFFSGESSNVSRPGP